MKQPAWKQWLSYLFEMHIESAPSELHPHLYVSLRNGRYQLCTSRAIYSFGDLYGNFRQAFNHLNWDLMKGKKVLLLGFGLGSIPYMLEKVFKKDFEYTAVEKDEHVLALAQKYMLDELASQVTFNIMDAARFVESAFESYDLICMDVFVEDEIPEEMQSLEYCEALSGLLADEGILLFNRLSRTHKDLKLTKKFFEEVFLEAFPQGHYLDVFGNWILTNRKDALIRKNSSD